MPELSILEMRACAGDARKVPEHSRMLVTLDIRQTVLGCCVLIDYHHSDSV